MGTTNCVDGFTTANLQYLGGKHCVDIRSGGSCTRMVVQIPYSESVFVVLEIAKPGLLLRALCVRLHDASE